jgi:formylglycine-generating enzyme required for sulfatase activity/tRNA A-37 threonylcarbamoyl transferase component Bud32
MNTQYRQNWVKNDVIGGRYRIEEFIAQGGMSTVYKATDPNLRRTVAIKLIHPHLARDPEFVRRFGQEAEVVAKLRHPNIVQVYDFNHEGDLYYMVLEYVLGETLQARLKSLSAHKGLRLAYVVDMMTTICDTVAYAHKHGMIHRDLKPANVMLNAQDQPILMDFGVAKMLGAAEHTMTGTVIGTALYMSPEQARGERPDGRSDIYSLGVMLFEMITGQPPFEADTTMAVLMKHVSEPVPDIHQINENVPDELVALVEKALAKDPALRFQSAADMAEALRAVEWRLQEATSAVSRQVPTPIPEAPPASSPQPDQRRSWAPWIAGAAVILVLLVATGFLLVNLALRYVRPLILDQQVNLPSAERMIKIDEGVYLVGADALDDQHSLPQQIELEEYWIDQYEVTNAEYATFMSETGHQPPAAWPDGNVPAGQEQHPVQGVSWDSATAYCEWAQKRLPSEAEWEVAARGPQAWLFPWGNDEHAVELPRSGTYAIGSIPTNRSPVGAFDMAGNAWEWVGETYTPITGGYRVLRGGSNDFLKDAAYRLQGDPNVPTMIATAGIRCAADEAFGESAVNALDEVPLPAPTPVGELFQDQFADPDSGWPTGEEDSHRFGYHPAAFYHLELSVPNDSLTIFRGLTLSDFTAEVEVLVDHTETSNGNFDYGVAIRQSGDQYYAFTISPRTQGWKARKHSPEGWEVLAEGTNESIRGLNAPDKLRIGASGSDFAFYLNDEIVATVKDSDYASGDVGFILETQDESLVHVHYASLTIRDVETAQTARALREEFINPDGGWPTGEQATHRFGYHPPDFYHLEVSAPNDRLTVSHVPASGAVTVETVALVDHTQSPDGEFRYGLTLRQDGDQYYAFAISPRSKTWQAVKSSADGLSVLAEGNSDAIQDPSIADKLRVDANGDTFTFYINTEVVAQIHDADYANGEVGFFVETLSEPLVHVHYDLLTIEPLD